MTKSGGWDEHIERGRFIPEKDDRELRFIEVQNPLYARRASDGEIDDIVFSAIIDLTEPDELDTNVFGQDVREIRCSAAERAAVTLSGVHASPVVHTPRVFFEHQNGAGPAPPAAYDPAQVRVSGGEPDARRVIPAPTEDPGWLHGATRGPLLPPMLPPPGCEPDLKLMQDAATQAVDAVRPVPDLSHDPVPCTTCTRKTFELIEGSCITCWMGRAKDAEAPQAPRASWLKENRGLRQELLAMRGQRDALAFEKQQPESSRVRRLKADLSLITTEVGALRMTVEVARQENDELRREVERLRPQCNAPGQITRQTIDNYCLTHDMQLVTHEAFKELQEAADAAGTMTMRASEIARLRETNKSLRSDVNRLLEVVERMPPNPAARPLVNNGPLWELASPSSVTFARLREGWTPPISSEAKVLCPDASEEP